MVVPFVRDLATTKRTPSVPHRNPLLVQEELGPKRKSFDTDGFAHELTFSCYRRQRFFDEAWIRDVFLDCLRVARKRHGFLVWAYVVMPEHVHLLVAPQGCNVRDILRSIKQPTSQRVIAQLKRARSPLLHRMESRARRGNSPYSFWQVGGGYDRNLFSSKAIWAAIEYIHQNPVRRGLVDQAEDWPWSSCRSYWELPSSEMEGDRCDVWMP